MKQKSQQQKNEYLDRIYSGLSHEDKIVEIEAEIRKVKAAILLTESVPIKQLNCLPTRELEELVCEIEQRMLTDGRESIVNFILSKFNLKHID